VLNSSINQRFVHPSGKQLSTLALLVVVNVVVHRAMTAKSAIQQ